MSRKFWQTGTMTAILTLAVTCALWSPANVSGVGSACRKSETGTPQASGHSSSGSTLALSRNSSGSASRYQSLSDCLAADSLSAESLPPAETLAPGSPALAASPALTAHRGRSPPSA